jgi:hypothetical protein
VLSRLPGFCFYKRKSPSLYQKLGDDVVGLVGLEPMTSTMSSAFPAVRRLTGNPYKSTVCACLLVWVMEKKGKNPTIIILYFMGIEIEDACIPMICELQKTRMQMQRVCVCMRVL